MKCDGVLFDLDGTLWNATEAIAVSWQIALKDAEDISTPPTVKQLESVMGMTAEQLTATLFPHLSLQRRMELFDHCCQVENEYLRIHGGKLYEGVEETLSTLSQRFPLAVVSNCNNGYIECFLDAHHLRPYFKDWECIGRTGKEKWENIKLVVERNRLSFPVYVGDTSMDFESARKAGLPFLHADYGFGAVPGVPQLSSPRDLLELVESL